MTFSIIAYERKTQSWGVAVASKFLAVGAYVPFARAHAGAIATQAAANLSYGPRGLDLLSQGLDAPSVVHLLTSSDVQREERQLGAVDANGKSATFTGSRCMPWAGGVAGGIAGDGFAAQGNILANEHVVPAMVAAFEAAQGELAARLLAALVAGDGAGGDGRGRQGAAILVVRERAGYLGLSDVYVDLRVDDHPDPINELQRLLALHALYFGKTPPEHKLRLDGALLTELQHFAVRAGRFTLPVRETPDAAARQMLDNFIGAENLEERVNLADGTIDPPALAYLRERYG